ncbi:DegT/DnrJ/EryC1/StrS family aminotransferase [Cellulomonas sp. P22]|uniref:DegT/DnrJ/EryC1/StrS family aminotransferase n=1 Tax=Cellulomonas sp. P22 TaxID=3373189 RepID=UPI0037B9D834
MNDLSRAIDDQRAELDRAWTRVLDSAHVVMGPEHTAFEAELAALVGANHAVAVGSGTDALELMLRATMPVGREVVVTAANCGGYTTTAARRGGFAVRYVDVDAETHCVDPKALVDVLDARVGVVVVTHLYGRAADVAAVRSVCEPLGIRVVEDCAQAIGASTVEGPVGSRADAAAFSFYPTKNLGALGDGGAVTTSSEEIAGSLRALRQYGWDGKYRIGVDGGRNSRLDEVQAAVLRTRMPFLGAQNQTRRGIIRRYVEVAASGVRVLPAEGAGHVGHLAVVVADDRASLRRHLESQLIRTDVHYPVPDHLQSAFRDEYAEVSLPVTESLAERIVTLPCFAEMTSDEVDRVCAALASY